MQEEDPIQTKEGPNNTFMKNLLKSSQTKNSIISIYSDVTDTNRFSAGFVMDVTDSHFLIANVAPYGQYDGYSVAEINSIYRITPDGKYNDKLFKLYALCNQKHEKLNYSTKNLKTDLLSHALENRLAVTIELLNSNLDDIQGFVIRLDDDVLTMGMLDDYSNYEGESTFFINDITHIICDSDKESALKMLYPENTGWC